jgi:hypothetical protein
VVGDGVGVMDGKGTDVDTANTKSKGPKEEEEEEESKRCIGSVVCPSRSHVTHRASNKHIYVYIFLLSKTHHEVQVLLDELPLRARQPVK